MPKISVIVPVYKTEKYLRHCVDSILAQTFTDFELILVDDGSPDNSGAICDEYAQKDDRIHVIHQKNAGVSTARNAGIGVSNGEYLAFVDSDDWLSSLFLASLYEICQKTNSDICVSVMIRTEIETISENDSLASYYTCSGREAIRLLGEENSERFRAVLGKLVRKSIVVNMPFPKGRKWSEDSAVVYRWLFEANTVAITDTKLYYYRLNQEGTTANKNSLDRIGIVDTYSEMIAFFDEYGFPKLKEKYSYLYADNLAFLFFSVDKGQVFVRKELKSKMKSLLLGKKTRKVFSIKKTPYPFEVLFPTSMKLFYLIKSLFCLRDE